MENPFKKINEPPKKISKDVKGKVLEDANSFKLLTDFLGVFSTNYAAVAESFFNKKSKTKTK